MAVMGFRLAQRANGVSELHGEVSRGMFNGLWPAFDEAEVPITSITNGVHAPTWVAREVFELAQQAGRRHRLRRRRGLERRRRDPLGATSGRPSASCASGSSRTPAAGCASPASSAAQSPAELGWTETALDPDVLTIGFARRAASYKRLTLMLSDPERLKRLLLHPERPIQLIMAGKAHPADDGGKKLIQAIVQLADDPEVRHRVAYLPNYDIAMAQPLYPGCDVWLNNPLRPYEACGTSGMKAALNGGLNLSILDGWWDEWYDGNNGWAIPSADGVEDPDKRDDIEANALYDLIEKEVAPRFYDLDDDGRADPLDRDGAAHPEVARPQGALDPDGARVRRAPLRARPPSSSRAMNDSYEGAAELAAWKSRVVAGWSDVHVDHVETEGLSDSPEIGGGDGPARLRLARLARPPTTSRSRSCTAGSRARTSSSTRPTTPLALAETYEGGRHRFDGHLELSRAGSFGYTVRILPRNAALASPAELGLVALA